MSNENVYVRDKSLGSTYMPTHTPVAVGPH